MATLLEKTAKTNFSFPKDADNDMAKAAVATDDVVLICREHESIPPIANEILS